MIQGLVIRLPVLRVVYPVPAMDEPAPDGTGCVQVIPVQRQACVQWWLA
ncbi:hypothetical protein LH460_04480 [Laribacter hongkongensis]|nr:hypothetical protein [Laribacter hongkongensis]MCG9123932.1 hypothetical protein [Laribacter hongkongensis]